MPGKTEILIRDLSKRKITKSRLRRKLKTLLSDLGVSPAELSLVLMDDRGIRGLNRAWRKKDRPTDVLSFPQREGKFANPHDPMLGDIVISVERAAAQAREHGHSFEREMDLLLVHGLLHLLGFEHIRGGKAAASMRAKEQELLGVLESKK